MEPENGFYEHVIILGFVTIDVKHSFDFISEYLKSKKILCNKIVLLASSLPLPKNSKYYSSKTESDLMQSIYKDSYISNFPYICITLPMIEKGWPNLSPYNR